MAEQSVYAAPGADLNTSAHAGDYPGMRRLPYFGWSLGIQFVYYAMLAVGGENPAMVMLALAAMTGASIYLLVQRLRNTGSNGWWAALILVPLVNIYIGLKALAFPEGYDDHKQLDTPAKVIMVLFLGSIALGILAAIAIPAMVAT
jgi:uncharacterized membrane protein YhaH (DUF805 family)